MTKNDLLGKKNDLKIITSWLNNFKTFQLSSLLNFFSNSIFEFTYVGATVS